MHTCTSGHNNVMHNYKFLDYIFAFSQCCTSIHPDKLIVKFNGSEPAMSTEISVDKQDSSYLPTFVLIYSHCMGLSANELIYVLQL